MLLRKGAPRKVRAAAVVASTAPNPLDLNNDRAGLSPEPLTGVRGPEPQLMFVRGSRRGRIAGIPEPQHDNALVRPNSRAETSSGKLAVV